MADWRQIQARIRKAKNSPDAQAKLSELFQRTRDAMVAWELGAIEEKAGRNDEAGKWYVIAAQRFRRAEWKKKAEEALARLGIPLPAADAPGTSAEISAEPFPAPTGQFGEPHPPTLALGEIPETHEEAATSEASVGAGGQQAGLQETTAAGTKRRRRGRRGGRGRRRKGPVTAPPSLPARAYAETAEPRPQRPPVPRPAPYEPSSFEGAPEPPRQEVPFERPVPQLPSERAAHGRAGDPALASRMAHLESMLRRLVAGPLHRLDEADEAPAGPGVFLLSDSDLITSYYIEACQTLRVGLGNLARGGSGRGGKVVRGGRSSSRPESGLKSNLAEHLGITEAKVSQYLKDHCVVRWIQLDDEAPHLAHFAIGVLRTPLNVD